MILTGAAIKKSVFNKQITIIPFKSNCCNPNSYNYRLGKILYEVEGNVVSPHTVSSLRKVEIEKDGSYLLLPGKLYLGHTYEVIGSSDFVPSLIGRSSLGRLGLFLQITADLGQLGNAHKWTLEMTVVQPLKIYPMMIIGQVSFWVPQGNNQKRYIGGYTSFHLPASHRSTLI